MDKKAGFIGKVRAFIDAHPVPIEYRSSVAAGTALVLLTSSLVVARPADVRAAKKVAAERAQAAQSIESPTATASSEASSAPGSVAPTVVASSLPPPKKGPVLKKGGVNVTYTPGGVPEADLFTPDRDRIGITDSTIKLCGHAALSLGPAFETTVRDLDVYWQWLRDNGGIYGRNVSMSWQDDKYTTAGATVAFNSCNDLNPFFVLGAIGFDQIPAARTAAESAKMLYIHHMAREDFTKKYSFSYLASVEKMGALFGEYVIAHHSGEKVGVVYRSSEDWKPGYDAFKRTVAGKIDLVADLPVVKQQSVYTDEIRKLDEAHATTVFFWENALMAFDIIKQGRAQAYHPHWLIFPFNVTFDKLEPDPLDKPYEGVAPWPAYTPGPHSGPWADEMRTFEAAQAKYGENKPNDTIWMTWLGMKQLHQLLLDCTKDCTRNKIAGLLLTGTHKSTPPACPIDFSRNGHVGGFTANAFESFVKPDATLAWRETESCKEHF